MNDVLFTPIRLNQLELLIQNSVEKALKAQRQPPVKTNRFLTIDELIEFLPEHPAKQTIYGLVSNRKIPYEKHGKKLYFREFKIQEWLDNGRQMNHLK